MRPLRDVLGMCVHQGQEPYLSWWLNAGGIYCRVEALWNNIEVAPDQYDWRATDAVMTKLDLAGAKAMLVCYATPGWIDPTVPPIAHWTGLPAIAVMPPDQVPRWQRFVKALFMRYPHAEANIATETTITNLWASGDPQQYIDLVLRPAAEVLKPMGITISSPGITMRDSGFGDTLWDKAMQHLLTFVDNAEDCIDFLDVHVYRETGEDQIAGMKRILGSRERVINPRTGNYIWRANDGTEKEDDAHPAWWSHNLLYMTEWGFTDDDGKAAQRDKIATVLDYLQEISTQDGTAENFSRAYLYSLFGSPAAILNDDGTPKLAALEIARRLAL